MIATVSYDSDGLAHSLKTLAGADKPRYRRVDMLSGAQADTATMYISPMTEDAIVRDLVSISLSPETAVFESQLNSVGRRQRLYHFIANAIRSGDINLATGKRAWSAWTIASEALSENVAVPDASCGPDGQFLFLWDKDEHHLELEIEASGAAYFFSRNRITGAIWGADYEVGQPLSETIITDLRLFV